MSTPAKSRSRPSDACKNSENTDPNVPASTPTSKPSAKTPAAKSSAKPKHKPTSKPAAKSPPPPQPPAAVSAAAGGERKFFVAKKTSRRAKKGLDFKARREAAYEALRQSHEEFFKNAGPDAPAAVADPPGPPEGSLDDGRMRRSAVMEAAMSSVPESGSGRVKHLVKAFETLLSISKDGVKAEEGPRVANWPLPGLQQPIKIKASAEETVPCTSSSLVFSSGEFFGSQDFERDSRLCSSFDSNGDRLSWGSRTSSGSRKSRRNSTDSSGRSWNKKLRVTSQLPFKLRTEQRGRMKEEHFIQKVKEMLMEEEKKRIPIAQGLPWTTDEPECLVKPPVKEPTVPEDLVLHSDMRAVERAEFDHYIADRISFAEQLKLERERQQKLEEEEEIRRLRRELVPRAQPMPYFDRPFVPKKSTRPRTVPKEPRFHIRQLKPCASMMGRRRIEGCSQP